MKFASLAALGLVASVDAKADPKETMLWAVGGFKGYHEGFEKAFYKNNHTPKDGCLDQETIDGFVKVSNPLAAMKHITSLSEDFTYFSDAAEVFENLSKCRFEGPAFDILHECAKDKTACTPSKFLENVTKNMFVLVGKMTSMAESFKGFPAKNTDDFAEQMSELGDDFGTFSRVMFNFHQE
jgi:hypothetical protein